MEIFSSCSELDVTTIKSHSERATRHIPHSELPPEIVEKRNERERLRVTAVNGEFRRLQRLLPTIAHRTRRVSKERILRLAVTYIQNLRLMIDAADGETSALTRSHQYGPFPVPAGSENRRWPGRGGDLQGQMEPLHEHYSQWPSHDASPPQGQTLEDQGQRSYWPASPDVTFTVAPPCGAGGVPPGGAWSMPALEDAIQGVQTTPSTSLTTSPASYPHTPSPPGVPHLTPSPASQTNPSLPEDDTCSAIYGAFRQDHFRFRPDDHDVIWDARTPLSPPAGLEENLIYNTCYLDR